MEDNDVQETNEDYCIVYRLLLALKTSKLYT